MPTQNAHKPTRPDKTLTSRQIGLIALIMTLVIVALWGGSYLIIDRVFPDLQSSGLFGNSFGAIQALFSALALAGVILAILLQNRELALQRSDLKSTRMEIGRQTRQFEGQKVQFESQKLQFELHNETLIQQRFENTFFQLLTLHHENVGSIADRKTEKGEVVETRGRTVFAGAYIPLKERYRGLKPESPEGQEALEADIELIRKQFSWFYRRFGPYFANFFSIIEFVDHNKIGSPEVNPFFISLLRAQLSGYELIFIYYYTVTARDRERYTHLAEKYHLFADLAKKDLLDPAHTGYFKQPALETPVPE
jgi:hypothetical protein